MAPKNTQTNQLLMQMGLGSPPKSLEELLKNRKKQYIGDKPFFTPFGIESGQSTGTGILKAIANPILNTLEKTRKNIGLGQAFIDPRGNVVGDYLSQVDPKAFAKDVEQKQSQFSGSEVFLPNQDTELKGNVGAKTMADVPGMDVFTDAGQQKLGEEANKAISNIINQQKKEDFEIGEASDADIDYTDSSVDGEVEGADTPAKKATVKALDEFLKESRPGVKPRTFDEYINEFGEATGLDVSGEADTKQALMSFGLALMQNRAGKGFDISKILTSVGEAGEAAMPDFRKATAEAKAIRAKAGSYALSKKESDQKKAMNRQSYFVIPKGDGTSGSITDSITNGKGRLARLNSFELNNLMNNEEFNKEFEIIDQSFYKDYAKAALTASGKKKFYQTGSSSVPLFAGADDDFSFKVQLPDMNNAPAGTKPIFIDNDKRVVGLISDMERSVETKAKDFEKLAQLLNTTDITVLDQGRSIVKQTLRNFGLNIGDTDPVKQIKTILTRIQATNAADILQEAGKTLSDNDRKMVKDIVGDVNFTNGDEAELRRKLSNLFDLIVKKGRANVNAAYGTLANAGVSIDRTNVLNQSAVMTKGKDNVFRFTGGQGT